MALQPHLLTQTILPHERVDYVGGIHWVVLLFAAVLVPFWGIGIPLLLATWVWRRSTELVVTSYRVVLKSGVIAPKIAEMAIGHVQSVEVNGPEQHGYGNVTITGSGGTKIAVTALTNPSELRAAIARLQQPLPPEGLSVERRFL